MKPKKICSNESEFQQLIMTVIFSVLIAVTALLFYRQNITATFFNFDMYIQKQSDPLLWDHILLSVRAASISIYFCIASAVGIIISFVYYTLYKKATAAVILYIIFAYIMIIYQFHMFYMFLSTTYPELFKAVL